MASPQDHGQDQNMGWTSTGKAPTASATASSSSSFLDDGDSSDRPKVSIIIFVVAHRKVSRPTVVFTDNSHLCLRDCCATTYHRRSRLEVRTRSGITLWYLFRPLLTNGAMDSVDGIDIITSANTTFPCVPSSHLRPAPKIDPHYLSTSPPPLTPDHERVPASTVSHSLPSPSRLSPIHVPVEQATPHGIAHEDGQERVEPTSMSEGGGCPRTVLAKRISCRHMGRRLPVEGCRYMLSWKRWTLAEV